MRFELQYFKTDRNGTRYYYDRNCPRCGGEGGSSKWAFTGYTCYECGGTGERRRAKIVKEYTPEYEAKLESARAKREAKREAEHEAEREIREAEKAKQEAEAAQREEERKARLAELAGNFIGNPGDKIEIEVTLRGVASYDTIYGTTTVYIMKDADGNTLVWKTGTGAIDKRNDETFRVKGTIKEHTHYNGINQTVLTRVKVI